jgi:hypothetical protein
MTRKSITSWNFPPSNFNLQNSEKVSGILFNDNSSLLLYIYLFMLCYIYENIKRKKATRRHKKYDEQIKAALESILNFLCFYFQFYPKYIYRCRWIYSLRHESYWTWAIIRRLNVEIGHIRVVDVHTT